MFRLKGDYVKLKAQTEIVCGLSKYKVRRMNNTMHLESLVRLRSEYLFITDAETITVSNKAYCVVHVQMVGYQCFYFFFTVNSEIFARLLFREFSISELLASS